MIAGVEKFGLVNLIEEREFQKEALCLCLNRLYELFSILQNEFNEIKSENEFVLLNLCLGHCA